jgi:hypothetical protein
MLVNFQGYEVVILENEILRTSWLVGRGTDVIEFLYKPRDVDFLHRSPRGIVNPALLSMNVQPAEGEFTDIYEGGWQEVVPCATVDTYKGARFGSFGEACLLPWDFEVLADSPSRVAVRFVVHLVRSPLALEKVVEIRSGEPAVYAREELSNLGGEPYDLIWGHHVAMGGPFLDESCRIHMPKSEVFSTPLMEDEIYSQYGRCVTPPGRRSHWPTFPDINGQPLDLSKPIGKGLYSWVNLDHLEAGWFAVSSGNKGVGFGMAWDKEIFPYMCLWQENEGRFGYPIWGRERCITIDPANSVLESISTAIARGDQITLLPGQPRSLQWTALAFEASGETIRHIDVAGNVSQK